MEMKTYTVSDVAKILGVYKQNLYKEIEEGRFYPVMHVGKRIVISELALKGYLYNLSKEEIDILVKEDIKSAISV